MTFNKFIRVFEHNHPALFQYALDLGAADNIDATRTLNDIYDSPVGDNKFMMETNINYCRIMMLETLRDEYDLIMFNLL